MNKPLTFLLLFGILLFPSFSFASPLTPENILRGINEERTKAGLSILEKSISTEQVAKAKIEDMAQYDYFAHSNPTTGKPYQDFFPVPDSNYSGPSYRYRGEILGRNFKTSEDLIQAWMNSPTHRHAMLNSVYTNTGIAILDGVIVQEFSNY